jgi:hypothetical protein
MAKDNAFPFFDCKMNGKKLLLTAHISLELTTKPSLS